VTKLEQDQINHLNSTITPKEIEAVINNLPTKKIPGTDGFSGEFYQTFKQVLIPIFFKLLHKMTQKEQYPIHSIKPQLCLYLHHTKTKQRKRTSD
jgi:UDP-3-O-acyl-N-acetylglucosamine deacetylase